MCMVNPNILSGMLKVCVILHSNTLANIAGTCEREIFLVEIVLQIIIDITDLDIAQLVDR